MIISSWLYILIVFNHRIGRVYIDNQNLVIHFQVIFDFEKYSNIDRIFDKQMLFSRLSTYISINRRRITSLLLKHYILILFLHLYIQR